MTMLSLIGKEARQELSSQVKEYLFFFLVMPHTGLQYCNTYTHSLMNRPHTLSHITSI